MNNKLILSGGRWPYKSVTCPTEIHGPAILRYQFAQQYVHNCRVLDAACNFGYGTYMLCEGGNRVLGIDKREAAIVYAKSHYKRENLEYSLQDALDIQADNDSFDVVVSLETIEHITEYRTFLDEIKRVLVANGLLVISTPNKGDRKKGSRLCRFHTQEWELEEFKDLMLEYFDTAIWYGQTKKGISKEAGKFILGILQ